MAINPEARFVGKISPSDTEYPYGKARNVTVPGDGTGTPFVAPLVNDLFGFQQAILTRAGVTPSGDPDNATDSQYLQALLGFMRSTRQVFTTDGTWTRPDGCTRIVATLIGAGGGGGGAAATAAGEASAGSGGSGGNATVIDLDVSAYSTLSVSVGAVGAGAAAGPNSGSDGGATTLADVAGGGTEVARAEGGAGGYSTGVKTSPYTVPGPATTEPDLDPGFPAGVIQFAGGFGEPATLVPSGTSRAGAGGFSYLGGSRGEAAVNTGEDDDYLFGIDATTPGVGGGGGASINGGAAAGGGAGGQGLVIITEYYN